MAETNGTTEVTDVQKKIIKQIEYYFGDINLSKDRFMQQEIKTDEGWIPLETMLKFNRLSQLSEGAEVITEAIKKSTSGLMEVSEDGKKIRRSPDKPLPANTMERKEELKKRTVYCKGFSLDATLDAIQEKLEQFGKVESVQLRRAKDKTFKGSVFAIYAQAEDAKKFLEAEDLKLGGEIDVVKSTKDDYFKRKIRDKKVKTESEANSKRELKEKEVEEREKQMEEMMVKGALLRVNGFTGTTPRDDIKAFFNDHSTVCWVDFEKDEGEAIIRFEEEGAANAVWSTLSKDCEDNKVDISGCKIEGAVLEGDDEISHWKKVFAARADAQARKKQGRRNQRDRRGNFQRGGKRDRGGRGRDRDRDDAPQAKKTKFDDEDTGDNTKTTEAKAETKTEDKTETQS
ncbi:unnamed protein product [Owenia fusiformis]|uniref:Uncharacterized protein n=1 Tax=Owenia fusiformis TaxID=6347 RepID=A0A8J1XRX3_OWEFU|nr:unnamed protein product [Owenia fusiformis]